MPNYSLAEIDALARKATRGAGYSWGMAEEAGKSVRWLSAYGLLGAEALAKYLTIVANDSQDFIPRLKASANDNKTIVFENETADKTPNAPICSLYCGTLINDLGHQLQAGKTLSFENTLFPLLALSQAGRVAETYGISIAFAYADTVIICNPNGIKLEQTPEEADQDTPPLYDNMLIEDDLVDDFIIEEESSNKITEKSFLPEGFLSEDSLIENSLLQGSLLDNSANVVCSMVDRSDINAQKSTHFPSPQSRLISLDTYGILEQFAHTTYAPATEESRLKGAG